MDAPILHHYDMSPYAEKIRLAFGAKGASWRSVQAPMVMPKPDLLELTGGYRRVPVLQLGADVYCDTHCIARVLDEVLPGPALFPAGQETQAHSLSRWSESTFMMVVLAFFGIGDVFPEVRHAGHLPSPRCRSRPSRRSRRGSPRGNHRC